MRLSANLGFLWPDLPLTERIAAAGRAGFEAVELHWPYETPAADVAVAARAAGVRVLALNSPRGDVAAGEFGLACLPGREAEFAESVEQATDYATRIGAGAVHVMAGVPADEPEESWQPRLVENLAAAARMAQASGMIVLLEALNRADNPSYAYARVDEAEAIRARIGAPNVRLMLDAYHVAREGGDPAEVWFRLAPVVGHVQIAGVPHRAEPDLASPPLAGLLSALSASGYQGWIGAEYRPAGSTDAGLGWRQKMPRGT